MKRKRLPHWVWVVVDVLDILLDSLIAVLKFAIKVAIVVACVGGLGALFIWLDPSANFETLWESIRRLLEWF